jgi:hypothetical protein
MVPIATVLLGAAASPPMRVPALTPGSLIGEISLLSAPAAWTFGAAEAQGAGRRRGPLRTPT